MRFIGSSGRIKKLARYDPSRDIVLKIEIG